MSNWHIPPIKGQVVMLDPSNPDNKHHLEELKGLDFVVFKTQYTSAWLETGEVKPVQVMTLGEDFEPHVFHPTQLIPVSGSFIEYEEYDIRDEDLPFLAYERYITEQIIKRGARYDVSMINKEYRINVLQEIIDIYDLVKRQYEGDEKKIARINERYASVLEELAITREKEPKAY